MPPVNPVTAYPVSIGQQDRILGRLINAQAGLLGPGGSRAQIARLAGRYQHSKVTTDFLAKATRDWFDQIRSIFSIAFGSN